MHISDWLTYIFLISGVLLVGPPGCGKTLVAKAIANEAGINFISVKGPELINMYVGESERAVRSVFLRAKNSRPCVIFFDELDSLAPKRSSSSSDGGSSSRVVNQLLTEMDGVEGREGVWIMAATNRPDILDPAVMRPGRLDKILYVGFPEPGDRVEILRAITKHGSKPRLSADVDLETVGRDARCAGFSGADVGNLVRQASMVALREMMRAGDMRERNIELRLSHFEAAFSSVKPSVSRRDRSTYEAMKKKYGVNQAPVVSDNVAQEEPMESDERVETEVAVDPSVVTEIPEDVTEDISESDRPGLRFLAGMEVRMSDSSSDDKTRGVTGVVEEVEAGGHQVTILCPGDERRVLVQVTDLDHSMPEEGDTVRSLVWDDTEEAGTVENIDDSDEATVVFSNNKTKCPVEKLCNVDPDNL